MYNSDVALENDYNAYQDHISLFCGTAHDDLIKCECDVHIEWDDVVVDGKQTYCDDLFWHETESDLFACPSCGEWNDWGSLKKTYPYS